MKRLILVFVVAIASCMVCASTFKWNAVNIYNGSSSIDASDKYNGTAYLFDAATISQEVLYNSVVANSGFDYAAIAVANMVVDSGSIALTGSDFEYGSAGSVYDFYFAIFNSDDGNANKIYVSAIKSGKGNEGSTPTSLAFASQNDGTTTFSALAPTGSGYQGAGYWSQVSGGDVPEPTTCSLLLVGLAGIGLKRLRKRGKKSA